MTRTAIMLPENLKARAETYAAKHRVSLAEVIRESLEEKLAKREIDSFFGQRQSA